MNRDGRNYEVKTSGGANQQVRYTFTDGAQAFEMTVKVLQELCEKYSAHPDVVQFRDRLLNGFKVRAHDQLGEIHAIVNYFQGTYHSGIPDENLGTPLLHGDKGSYRYTMDPYGTELFQAPTKVIRDIQAGESGADCDDVACACAAVIASAGYPVMLMMVDAGSQKGRFNHVMLASKTVIANPVFGDEWFPVELIHPFEMGRSVRISSYIPLLVKPYDLTHKEDRLIPKGFK